MARSAELLVVALALSFCTAASGEPKNASVWFVSWQHTGHIKALCPIAQELQARGWGVHIAVHDEVSHQVPKGLPVISAGPLPWSWDEELHFRRTLWDPMPPTSPAQDPREENNRKADLSERYFAGSQNSLATGLNASLQALPRDRWPRLLVIDVSSVGAMDLAEQLGLSFAVISSWPVGPTLQSIGDETAFAHPWLPSELFALPQSADEQGFADRLKRAVATFALPRFMGLAGFHSPRRELRRKWGLGGRLELLEVPRLQPGGERPLVLVLSHWGLDRPRMVPPHVQLVGPVEDYMAQARGRAPLPESVQAWLSQGSGHVVYVSFGTNVQPRSRMVRALLGGMARLESAGVRFLWDADPAEVEARAAGEGESPSGNQLQSLPENLLMAPRVDQLALLASGRISAFVTHCGLNSVHEALHFGVPLIGLPFLGDQLITAFLLEEVGAGVRLAVPPLSDASFEAAVLRTLTGEGYREGARRAGALGRLAGGARRAVDALEAVAEHGAAHLQTIGERQPMAGRLWDVHATLLAVPALALALLWWAWGAAATGSEGRQAPGRPEARPAHEAGAARKKKRP